MFKKIQTFLKSVRNSSSLMEVIQNFNWLFLDRIVRIALGFAVNAWVMRYLGPTEMGKWASVLGVVNIFTIIAAMGQDSLITRDLVKYKKENHNILGTSFFNRLILASIVTPISILTIYILYKQEHEYIVLGAIASGFILSQVSEIIVYFNQSILQSKKTVIAKGSTFVLFCGVKVYLILNNQPLTTFAWAFLIEGIVSAFFLFIIYQTKDDSIKNWTFSQQRAKYFLKNGWILALSGLAYMVYMNVDKIMLNTLLESEKEVGIYHAATKVYEVPIAILAILTNTFYPKLTAFHKKGDNFFFDNYKRLVSLITLLVYGGFILTWIIAPYFIPWAYGEEYQPSVNILMILMIGQIFMYNSSLRGSYLVIYNRQKVIFVFAILTSLLNILLNYLLIPQFKGLGAAAASSITLIISAIIFNLIFPETRKIFIIQLRGLLLLDIISAIRSINQQKSIKDN